MGSPPLSPDFFRHLCDGAAYLILSVAPDGRVMYANRACCDALGYGAEEMTRLRIDVLLREEDRPAFYALLDSALAGARCSSFHLQLAAHGKTAAFEAVLHIGQEGARPEAVHALLRPTGATAPLPSLQQVAGLITGATAVVPSRSLRILLADDNPFNQRVASLLLRKEGHQVRAARNGREALEALEGEAFDLVLMDLQMPEMDGVEATWALRRREAERGRRTPVIAVTASTLDTDRQRCREAGMDGYLTKPLRAQALRSVIAQAVATGGGGDELGEVWGPGAALARVGGDRELLREAAHVFLKDSQRLVSQARAALTSGDFTTLGRTAHTLKGSTSFFDGAAAVAAAIAVESSAASRDRATVGRALVSLENEITRLRQALAEGLP